MTWLAWLLRNWKLVAIGLFTATEFFWARHQLAQADAQG